MGRIRIKRLRWKGPRKIRHMRLIEFKASEAELFEALTIIYFSSDAPDPKTELKASIKAEDILSAYPESKDSTLKMVGCPFCRKAVFGNPRIYTLPEDRGTDLILDDRVFDYIFSRFSAWEKIVDAKMKRPFAELQERFDAAKTRKGFDEKPLDDIERIQAYIAKRDAPVSADTNAAKAVTETLAKA